MTSTGLKLATDTWYRGVQIICLDVHQRLLYSFAVNTSDGYHEFRNVRQAQRYIRSLGF